ncbi:hypothetical protein ScPMuIL_000154 [Solemya velum]
MIVVFQLGLALGATVVPPCRNSCIQGNCINDTCVCKTGWKGSSCNECGGRVRLTEDNGVIIDGFGNYSEDNKCAWLISPKNAKPNSTIRLRIEQFETECGWDHLYMYDGDSVFAPLIAAYSGLLKQEIRANGGFIDIVTRSGTLYLYFFSDAAYNLTGFNVTYSIEKCIRDCSGNGACNNGVCHCKDGFIGDGCQRKACPDLCSVHGVCNSTTNTCQCHMGFGGADCSKEVSGGLWEFLNGDSTIGGRASHKAVIVGDDIWITGGYAFHQSFPFLVKYKIITSTWTHLTPKTREKPHPRYGHSVVYYNRLGTSTLYMFGGVVGKNVSRGLWIYTISQNTWDYKPSNASIRVAGHTAHVVDDVMYVFFGHNPKYGYMNIVQEYHFLNSTWIIPTTTGAIVQGGYGHSSVLDTSSKHIYIYGGYHSSSTSSYILSDALYKFEPSSRHWTVCRRSGIPQYLHSAVVMNGLMLVYGGNIHNDTSFSLGAKCYSNEFLAFDFECNAWHKLESPPNRIRNWRYGHSAVVHKNSQNQSIMYAFGGYNGHILDDMIAYSPGNCTASENEGDCLTFRPGMICVWVNSSVCMERSQAKALEMHGTLVSESTCNPQKDAHSYCKELDTCQSCQSSEFNCSWCGQKECSDTCSNSPYCPSRNSQVCGSIHNCFACHLYGDCNWSYLRQASNEMRSTNCQADISYYENSTSVIEHSQCTKPCHYYTSCENCTHGDCMWCGNQQQCVDINSYVASFVYGQCMEWTKKHEQCKETRCADIHNCHQCHANPSCGWCNNESNTGLGRCMEGGFSGPVINGIKDHRVCPLKRWYFTDCPLCQCNGHSSCISETDECMQCKDLTEGLHCERCQDGFFGNASNGGNCSACDCNGQADTCDRETGKCFCRTKGVLGDKCDGCDELKKYHGNPKYAGTCYYELLTDFQFTFNLSKKDDQHYTEINFRNVPPSSDRDVDFKLNCSGTAYINITTKSNNHPEEKPYAIKNICTFYRTKFQHRDHEFGADANTTILVYVFGFQTPFGLQISFSQSPSIDLVHFFVTFFSCFLSLLIIAAALYKLKHVYDNYRIRLRRNVEREEMASRPFATALIEIERNVDSTVVLRKDITDIRKRKKIGMRPGQIALEPLNGQKAAVLSMFVQLPTGDEDWTPSGQSGLAVASALVTLGHTRKQSVEYTKGEKPRIRKPAFTIHGDTCV